MRFRPANISLINRRHYLPRLLLSLSLKYKNKSHPYDSKMLTGSHHINVRVCGDPGTTDLLDASIGLRFRWYEISTTAAIEARTNG
jgi:hypothetical protein